MAKPIKNTPILKGKDAKRFLENFYSIASSPHTAQQETARKRQAKRAEKTLQFMRSISKNAF